MRHHLLATLTLLPLITALPLKADLTPVVEYTSTSTLDDTRPFTQGYEFNVSTTFDITALGYWVDGLNNDHAVGIWNDSGALLASTVVLNTDPVIGHFQYATIPTLVLTPGNYVIAGQLSGKSGQNTPFPNNAQGITSQAGYTWIIDEQIIGAGLNFPTVSTGIYGNNGIFDVDFATGGSAVPEPSEMLPILLVSPVVCIACMLRQRSRRKPVVV